MHYIESLIHRWAGSGSPMRAGVSPDQVDSFEQRHGVVMPEDMRAFYTLVDGQDLADPQSEVRVRPLAEVRRVKLGASLERYGHLFAFADFLLESHLYALQIARNEAEEAIYLVEETLQMKRFVAGSFSEFLELVDGNSERLFPRS